MDNMPPGLAEKSQTGGGVSNGSSFRRPVSGRPLSTNSSLDGSSPSSPTSIFNPITVVVQKDENGYGMKISGDYPVYVQSVKEGGPAEKAGLQCNDIILQVNGVNVTQTTHSEVVNLIKASTEVKLTVQQNSRVGRTSSVSMTSPTAHIRSNQQNPHSTPIRATERITGPQPVDVEKRRQLNSERIFTLRLMMEQEQLRVDSLRSDLAKATQSERGKIEQEYQQAIEIVNKLQKTLQETLKKVKSQSEHTVSPTSSMLGHHRTKSNPDPLGSPSQTHKTSTPTEASKRLIASESMQDLYKRTKSNHPTSYDVDSPYESPSGTPPPPYRGIGEDGGQDNDVQLRLHGNHTPDVSPLRGSVAPDSIGQNIMSMEDDDASDQELSQLEDHGPFKSLFKLCDHHAHLAVFMNYVISNSDPSSLLFYLITNLYEEGTTKEMKKWAYEIHSSFLVPGAPLRLNNVDENYAREIDDVLQNDSDDTLKFIFQKARSKAREELHEQLADFRQKRTAGLGTLFGPPDAQLDESIHDKSKELKIIESILLPKIEPYLDEVVKDDFDIRRFTTTAALGTIMAKFFGLKSPLSTPVLERCPTFVSKDKRMKEKFLFRKSNKKLAKNGHYFVAQHYYTVTYCNYCQLIICGIGPQGFQCSNCNLNVHRHNCVDALLNEESCQVPKDRGDNRISKLMDGIRPKKGETRRKPSSLNITHMDRAKKHSEDRDDTLGIEFGDRPVSGVRGVEKRPDTVRETEERSHNDDENAAHDRLHGDITHHAAKTKNSTTNINRSESYRERIPQKKVREKRKTSDPNLSKTNDVDLDSQGLSYNTNSGSSSNSSLSTRSLDSPSAHLEMVTATQQRTQEAVTVTLTPSNIPPLLGDSDSEADWTKGVDENVLKSLSKVEKKRQEVINELFRTEKSHVRNLKILNEMFLKPMQENQILPPDQLQLLFQNLEEMLDIHSRFNNAMKARKKEGPLVGDIGDILLAMFDGAEGNYFQRAASVFCAKQQIALEELKTRRKSNTKLDNFLKDAEGNPECRRLQLKDMLPTVILRLTKYPLLFENLAKYSERGSEEQKSVQSALERSKEILNQVNQAVRAAEDYHTLSNIQKRLDKSALNGLKNADHPMTDECRNLDLRKHKLIHEGPLTLRIKEGALNRQKLIDIHVLLLDDAIILLQKQDDKYMLKFYNSSSTPPLSPIVKIETVIVRRNAAEGTALYLVSLNSAQIYDLIAPSENDIKIWLKHISEAAKIAEGNRNRDSGKGRRIDLSASLPQSPPDAEAADESLDKTKEPDESSNESDRTKDGNDLDTSGTSQEGSESIQSNESSQSVTPTPHASPSSSSTTHSDSGDHGRKSVTSSPSQRRKAEPLRLTTVENSLIQPSEVIVSQKPVLTAEPVLTPLEQLRLKDEAIRRALLEKQQLVADILHVPREEFDTIAEMAGEPSVDKEATELVLAAVSQANQLAALLNESLRVTEEEAVTVTSEVQPGCSPRGGRRKTRLPGVPAQRLQGISTSLNSQLTQLLKIIKDRDEERERLRKELQKSREQIHVLHEAHRKSPRSPSHSMLDESAELESGDKMPEQADDANKSTNEDVDKNQQPQISENRELKSDATNEVFVDALSGDSETLETNSEPPETITETEEDPPA